MFQRGDKFHCPSDLFSPPDIHRRRAHVPLPISLWLDTLYPENKHQLHAKLKLTVGILSIFNLGNTIFLPFIIPFQHNYAGD